MTAPAPIDEQAATVAEIAEMLNVSTDTVYTKAQAGDIPAFKVGRVWRFYRSQVNAALAEPVDPWRRSSHSRARRRAA